MMNNMMQVNVMERSEKFIFSKDQDTLNRMISSIESAGELYERENLPDPIKSRLNEGYVIWI